MRILVFANFPPPYTGQTVMTDMYINFLKQDHDVTIINTSSGKFHLSNRVFDKLGRLADIRQNIQKLRAILRSKEFDCFYFVSSSSILGNWRDLWTLKLLKRYPNLKIVTHIHSGNYASIFKRKISKKLTSNLFEGINSYIFLSKILADRCDKYIADNKIQIVPNTSDSSITFSSNEISGKIKERTSRKQLNILFLSNMIESKGYQDLLDALIILKEEKFMGFHAKFIGSWPSQNARDDFQKKVTKHNLSGNIEITGPIKDRPKIKEILFDTDIFILPTYYPVEAQPATIIEALNAGVPVISTHHASIPDMIEHGVDGFLFHPKDIESIAKSIKLLDDQHVWGKYSEAARKKFESHFSNAVIKDTFLNCFTTL